MNTRIRTLSPLVLAAALLTACVDDSQTAALEPEADAVTADVTTPDSSADATPTDAGPTADADAPPPMVSRRRRPAADLRRSVLRTPCAPSARRADARALQLGPVQWLLDLQRLPWEEESG